MDLRENRLDVIEQFNESELAQTVKGLKREFGDFVAEFTEDGDIVIGNIGGWQVVYPVLTASWIPLSAWLTKWDEESAKTVFNFINGVVYPTSVRLANIDGQYVEDIYNAHLALNERVKTKDAE